MASPLPVPPDDVRRGEILASLEQCRAQLTTAELVKTIPRECFVRKPGREAAAIATSIGVSIAAWWLLVINPYWWLLPPIWFLAGTAVWGLYVIGHDCGHGSFSSSGKVNAVVGHFLLTPFLYPFHAWRLLHHHHHSNTNSLERDIDWRPLPVAVYRKLSVRPRFVYRMIRTWFWWAGTMHQWATMAFDLKRFKEGKDRDSVRFSIIVVAIYAAVFFPTMLATVGVWGLVKYFFVPWAIAYGWFSTVTLMHHSHVEVPFLDKLRWSAATANLAMTIYCRFPRWCEFLSHDINVHVPHHIAPSIPFYRLRQAHEAIKSRWPDLVREKRFRWRDLVHTLRSCQLVDRKSGFYVDFSAAQRKKRAAAKT